MPMKTEELLFLLLRFTLCGEQIKEKIKTNITPESLEKVFALAKSHDLAHLAGDALGRMGLLQQDEIGQKFRGAALGAVRRYMGIKMAFSQVCSALEEANIPYIPLKGAVMRAYYPQPWMRTSCDVDVLIKEDNLISAIRALEEKGFENQGRSFYDVSLFSPQGVHVELHFNLITDCVSEQQSAVLSRVWEAVEPVGDSKFHFAMPDELFYFYHIAHMAKHFKEGGCGMRPVLDVWVLNHAMAWDMEKRNKLLEKGELLIFASHMERLAEAWLGTMRVDRLLEDVSAFILHNGAYGTYQAKAVLQQRKKRGLQYVLHRVFLPYQYMKYHYPILQRHKWLLPFCEIVRWVRLLFNGGIRRISTKVKTGSNVSEAERAGMIFLVDILGI